MQFKDHTFLITGGGSGLGAATAKLFAEQGANVVLADVNADAIAALAGQIGPHAAFIRTDVTDETSVQAAVDLCKSAFGGIHGAVNCAGVAPGERVVGKSGPHLLANFVRTININLIGTFNVIRLAAHAMSTQSPDAGFDKTGTRGVIINTSSVPMLQGMPEEVRASLGAQVPFPPRLGTPEEYAALAKHIVENEVLNGTVIRLDGAIRMGAK